MIVGLITIGLIFLCAGFFSYVSFGSKWFGKKQSTITQTIAPVISVTTSTTITSLPVVDIANVKIAYTKEIGNPTNTRNNTEIWLMNADGSNAQKLSGADNARLLNNVSSAWIYYESSGGSSSKNTYIYAYNFHTKQTKRITLNGLHSQISLQAYSISPDSTILAITVNYTPLPCDPTCTEGDPSTYSINKDGTYFYDINSEKITYTGGNYFSINNWSPDSTVMYVSNSATASSNFGDFEINVKSKVVTKIDSIDQTKYFDYYSYPLVLQNINFVDFHNHNSTGGEGDEEIGLQSSGVITSIDAGSYYPAVEISPDQENIAYVKPDTLGATDSRGVIMLYNISNKIDKRILSPTTGEQISLFGWLSNDTLLVLKTTNPQKTGMGDIYSLNINTGTLTNLSQNSKVQTYLSPL